MTGADPQRDLVTPPPEEEWRPPEARAKSAERALLERVLQATISSEEEERRLDAGHPVPWAEESSLEGELPTADRKTAADLIAEGQGLVRSLAVKILRSIPVRVDLDDLIGYGQVGLVEAARDFEPALGTQFSTFAYYRVRGAIYDGLSKMTWTSRAQYRRYRIEQMADEARTPEAAEHRPHAAAPCANGRLPRRGGPPKRAVVYLASQSSDIGSEDADFQDPHDSVATLVARQEIGERLHQLVDGLPRLEARLIRTVYFEGANLQQAADRLTISKSWATRLHARALEKLARELRGLDA